MKDAQVDKAFKESIKAIKGIIADIQNDSLPSHFGSNTMWNSVIMPICLTFVCCIENGNCPLSIGYDKCSNNWSKIQALLESGGDKVYLNIIGDQLKAETEKLLAEIEKAYSEKKL